MDAKFLVVDGITKENYEHFVRDDAVQWQLEGTDRELVMVTSNQLLLSWQDKREAGIKTWTMSSWSLEEYFAACKNEEFYKQAC